MRTSPGPQPEANPSAPGPRSGVQAVFLVGFMGAGKTSVGQALGRRLGWPFEDLDQRIQGREGRSIAEIFRESGEAGFRRAEHAALRELLAELGTSPRVAALGGGAFVERENALLLERPGVAAVFLDAPVEELYRRCLREQDVERPLRRDEDRFRQLYEARRPYYLAARLRIETGGKDVDAVAAEVARGLGFS
jgi:shikimate kinase